MQASRATTRSLRGIAIILSAIGLFVFLTSAYYVLTNVDLTLRDVLPGSITAAVLLEATFQVLPQYVILSKHNPVLQTLSGPAVLLVWLYLMANIIVLGAEVNWWRANRNVIAAHVVRPPVRFGHDPVPGTGLTV